MHLGPDLLKGPRNNLLLSVDALRKFFRTLIDWNEDIVSPEHHAEDLLGLTLGERFDVSLFAVQMVSTEVATAYITLFVDQKAFALSAIIVPLSIIDFAF